MIAAAFAATSIAHAARAEAQDVVAVEWTNLVNASATGSTIQKTAGCSGCPDAGGTSRQAIASGDGYVEFKPTLGGRIYAGLGTTGTNSTDIAAIDFAFSFWPDGGWDIRERNTYRTEGRFAAGDVFRVAIVTGKVKYYKNGALVYTSGVTPAFPLVVDATLLTAGSSLAAANVTAPLQQPTILPVIITTTALPNGTCYQGYSASLGASGGSGAYAWTVSAGALPAGLALNAAGTISGTAYTAGTSTFTARATDVARLTLFSEKTFSIVITAPPPVTVRTTSIPSTRVDEGYSATLVASGGTGAFGWTLVGGALPEGLALDPRGAITGTARVGGRYTVTVRATDAKYAASSDDQALALTVFAATPPTIYEAISDRIIRNKGPLPQLGPAGHTFTDPVFGTRLARITDRATRPAALDRSYRTPSSVHNNAWSVDGRYFYVTSTDGTTIPYAFDAATMRATRLPSATDDGGLTFRFFNEPTFSYVSPGVIFGTYGGSGGNLRSVDQYDIASGVYSQILNLDTVVANLAGTYVGGLAASAGPVEKMFAFFGGGGQDHHMYLVAFDKDNPANRMVVNTLTSTVDGVPANLTLNFKIHAAAIDRSGRYVTIYPTATDMAAPRYAPPAYIWDLHANTFTATPLSARAGGHDTYGYGIRINQDCCTSSTWDAAQWQFRSLATPLTTVDLIRPVLLPKEVHLADHPSWHNAQPVTLVPFIDANYRFYNNSVEWRPWDEEIFAVQTDAPGTGAIVWRFAHHRSNTSHDTDSSRISFWYTPRVNVSPDGRFALFTSNWEKTLGTDPRGEAGGGFRQDVFLVELKQTAAPQLPVTVATTALPNGTAGTAYYAALQASGGNDAYHWTVVSGSLPAGLVLDAAGRISGTPSTAGTFTFSVRASDSANAANYDDQAFTIAIAAAAIPPVSIATTSLPDALKLGWYSVTVKTSGGRGPFTWRLESGALPTGLTLDAATGTISGNPRWSGTSTFTIRVTDSATPPTADTQVLSIRVYKY